MRRAVALSFWNSRHTKAKSRKYFDGKQLKYILRYKGDMHKSFCVRKRVYRPLVLWLVPVMHAATDAGCVQILRARDAPSDSCSLCAGCPFGGLKYRS